MHLLRNIYIYGLNFTPQYRNKSKTVKNALILECCSYSSTKFRITVLDKCLYIKFRLR